MLTACGGGGGYQIGLNNNTPAAPNPPAVPAPVLSQLSSPATTLGQVYIGDPGGRLLAYNTNGVGLWSFPGGNALTTGVVSSPAVSNSGEVYFTGMDGSTYSVDQNGQLRWAHQTGGAIQSSPALDPNGNLYVGSSDGILYSYAPDGQIRWQFDTGAAIPTSPSVYGPSAVFSANSNGLIHARKLDNSAHYAYQHNQAVAASLVLDYAANLYALDTSGVAFSLDSTGNLRWSTKIANSGISSPVIMNDGNLLYSSPDGAMKILNSKTGSIRSSGVLTGTIQSAPALAVNSTVYLANSQGTLFEWSSVGGIQTRTELGNPSFSSPLLLGNNGLFTGLNEDLLQNQSLLTNSSEQDTPWSRVRANQFNNARVDCSDSNSILASFSRFGQSDWGPDNTGQLQSKDNASFSGIFSDVAKDSFSLSATLFSTNNDDDTIALLIAFRELQNGEKVAVSAVRASRAPGAALGGTRWGLVFNRLDANDNIINNSVLVNQNNLTPQGTGGWGDYPGGTRVEARRAGNIISLGTSQLSSSSTLPIDESLSFQFDLSSNADSALLTGPQFFGLAAHSQPFASFRDVNLGGLAACTIQPN